MENGSSRDYFGARKTGVFGGFSQITEIALYATNHGSSGVLKKIRISL